MFTVLSRHAQSDWQSTEVLLYVIGKCQYYVNMDIYKYPWHLRKTQSIVLLYAHYRNTYQQGS